ncbi:fumarylacetoacetate hydrolase family protein [Novosphingobium pentaromativorans]|uniref:Putative ureidoglycolate lyase n=1 Tax=Novosphingobium pentaromativorans US6-1 TaxID=1088721 RepID=G6EFN5_9SPHN|nr:fumarylacetoacetate hydrolase family protein [Novosphingobium pentaromativorans]AIT81837.1 5-carboxymethyl-2-hydroxymuconate isomerase [Novosphingobium pentaromativorans US6-1]EHJ59906.1 putative ureidoglycolate lyase [Novosphingobium pentaromativorans US6-1]
MKFVSYEVDGRASYGLVRDGQIVDLGARFGETSPDLKSFITEEGWQERCKALLETETGDYSYDSVKQLPVIPNPEKILCVALNYHDHIAEADKALPGGREVPKYPVMFARMPDSVTGHNQDIERPKVSTHLDFEAEMAVVIGKPTPRYVKPEDALQYVFGYSAMNEGSVRDYQFHSRQLTPGKNFYHSGSIGPWLVTADEIPDPQVLDIEFRLNGKVLQKANTSDMIFSVAALITYITEWIPLKPGDIIASGTMGGVGFTREPPIFMKPGDRAEVEISKIGLLVNDIIDEV